MGFFTLPLARMVGPAGRVIALEIQDKMLAVLGRRVQKVGFTPEALPKKIDGRSVALIKK